MISVSERSSLTNNLMREKKKNSVKQTAVLPIQGMRKEYTKSSFGSVKGGK